MSATDKPEEAWNAGYRAAYMSILRNTLSQLGYEATEAEHARWVVERGETVAALRSLCVEFGDNDWPDDLHLADVIEKHLGAYLGATGGRRAD